ncbi:DUF4231 domain-containing protein [Mumia sp. zg.B21]|uniref:DUF4231 domain-containing protein n=1 Tax=Mumia sp. zg.B21 TaxID=2855447 RepID=UPI001C6E17C5|nr:DUF4231 domain-containing protein [Mumia sp. zg.B21]MBW9210113.1 DUF4231 domain-containing protein [Mumia sp. zg.B21]
MTAPVPATLDYPPLWHAADEKATEQQRLFYWATAAQLGALALAALTALIPASAEVRMGPAITLLLFLVAMVIQVTGVASRAEQTWYDARAAAESIKSAAWQFAVGGESFRLDDSRASSRFTDLLRDVLKSLKSLDIGDGSGAAAGVTESMKNLRRAPLNVRRSTYRRDRVGDQVAWYSSKAQWNKRRARQFGTAVVVIEALAVVLGLLRVMDVFDSDLLGAVAACAAGLIGWSQAKKYSSLAESYGVTSHEVVLVSTSLDSSGDEAAWAQSVHDAESAFSREHTLWRARRQGPH